MARKITNKYGSLSNLRNESDVEQFFVMPFLADLGYAPEHIKTKTTIQEVSIDKGRRRKLYVPDYVVYTDLGQKNPVIIIDAKSPAEPVDDGVIDAQLYASVLRRKLKPPKPEQLCVGVNGNQMVVKHYDSDTVLFSLSFCDFADDNVHFSALKKALCRDKLGKVRRSGAVDTKFELRTVAPAELPAIFEACHRSIWKAEKRSPASAFYEFAKIMFVKIDEDRRLHDLLTKRHFDMSSGYVQSKDVRFSLHWISQMEETTDNPVDTILFAQLSRTLETQIAKAEKKRIFEHGEGINLTPATIKGVVGALEHLDLFAVDEDLNGRMFETFLTATMRGEDLGQFFTPRSVVKFMVKMARLRATRQFMDLLLDGCCGTGGFLIEAMAEMSHLIADNRSLTDRERSAMMRQLRMENLWGIDAGKDPQMARIARLNMLLHKDGGSRIYFADALDKQLRTERGLPLTVRLETEELREQLTSKRVLFSCVLSNPPFSMTYEKKNPIEHAVLTDYELAEDVRGRPRSSLRSSVMFLERYWDLMIDNGRLITIMDDSVLNTLTSMEFRQYLLDKFTINAVIALPQNTFVKAQGSVKTSVLCLTKKTDRSPSKSGVFVAICENVGHSDSGKERPHLNQLPDILRLFQEYQDNGGLNAAPGIRAFIAPDVVMDNPTLRLDAHFFDPAYFATLKTLDRIAEERQWKVAPLEALLKDGPTGGATPKGALYPDDGPKFVRVQNVRPYSINWDPDSDPCIDVHTHTSALRRSQLKSGDVLLTITGVTYGIAAVVPDGFGEANINQHCVKLEVNERILPEYLSVFLNSDLCRPQLDRAVTGSSRPALDYPSIKALRILYPPRKADQKKLTEAVTANLQKASHLQGESDVLRRALRRIPEVLE